MKIIMYSKKKIFFYSFYLVMLTYLNYVFINLFSSISSPNIFKSISDLISLNNLFILVFIIILVFISLSYNLINILSKFDYYLIIGLSWFFSLVFHFISFGIGLNKFIISLLILSINILYVLFIFSNSDKNIIHYYLTSYFIMVLISFTFVSYFYFLDPNINSNINNFNNIIFENNLIVLDVLNSNSKQILTPYLNYSYSLGFSTGYLSSCFKNSIKLCNYSDSNIDFSTFKSKILKNEYTIFDKSKYTKDLVSQINDNLSVGVLKYFFLIYISLIMMVFSFFSPLILLVFNFFMSKFVKFFSWFFDPFGVD